MSSSVLIVEDEFFVALEMEHVLHEAGFKTVGIAADLETALAIAQNAPPEIAFVDVNLKDGPTGPVIAQRLRELYSSVIIFVTANPRMIDAPSGALGVMEKPCDETALQTAARYAQMVRRGLDAQVDQPPRMMLYS